jgi:hypothetical protein
MYSTKTKTDGSQLEKGATNGAAEFDTTTLLITLANKTSSLAKIFSVLEVNQLARLINQLARLISAFFSFFLQEFST